MRESRSLTLPRRIIVLCLLIASLVVVSSGPGTKARAASCIMEWLDCMEACPDDPDLILEACYDRCDVNYHWCEFLID